MIKILKKEYFSIRKGGDDRPTMDPTLSCNVNGSCVWLTIQKTLNRNNSVSIECNRKGNCFEYG